MTSSPWIEISRSQNPDSPPRFRAFAAATSVFLFSFFFALSSPSFGADAESIGRLPTFDVLLRSALEQSLELKRQALIRDQSLIDQQILALEDDPSLALSALWSERRPEANAAAATARNQTYTAQFSYPLYDFGKLKARRSQADFDARIQELGLDQINETLTWQMARTYLNAAASIHLYDVAQENLDLSASKLKTIERNYRNGLRPENDFVAAQADFGEARLAIERTKTEVLIAKKQLELLAAVGSERTDDTIDPLPFIREPEAWERLIGDPRALEPSIAQEIRDLQADQIEAQESVITASLRPDLDLNLIAQNAGSWTDTETSYTGQLQLSWFVPWSGLHRQERRLLQLRRSVIEVEAATELKERNDAITLAAERMSLIKGLWQGTREQLKLKQKQGNLIRSRYEVGKATALEISNSELELSAAKLEEARIANTYAAALLELAEAKRLKDPGAMFR